jgi:hypothetical protein
VFCVDASRMLLPMQRFRSPFAFVCLTKIEEITYDDKFIGILLNDDDDDDKAFFSFLILFFRFYKILHALARTSF